MSIKTMRRNSFQSHFSIFLILIINMKELLAFFANLSAKEEYPLKL